MSSPGSSERPTMSGLVISTIYQKVKLSQTFYASKALNFVVNLSRVVAVLDLDLLFCVQKV